MRLLLTFFLLVGYVAAGQNKSYLYANAIPVNDASQLNDSVYQCLKAFRLIMVGERHGTKEPAELVTGLARMFASHGDSVLVGMEIPESQMAAFLTDGTDSSIYESNFFKNQKVLDGRQSFAWADVVRHLKKNPAVQLFFFDRDENETGYDRDSLMAVNIQRHILMHPTWRTITLSGNAHVITKAADRKTAYFLKHNDAGNADSTVCTIGNYYQTGDYYNNLGNGLERITFGREPNYFDSTGADKYLLIVSSHTTYPYTAMYYTRTVTASEPVQYNINLADLKAQLNSIYQRDQKTRKGIDSQAFTQYIDSCNVQQIENIIGRWGWVGKSLVGSRSNLVLFLVIQHADLATQKKYIPLFRLSVEEGESNPAHLAMLEDRILMREGRPQLYGTQIVFNKQGTQEFYPIADEQNVNSRRQKVGLQPIEEYGRLFGIQYTISGK